ncbi:hypothetical protein QBC47DRAFT_373452 [Echria macrotheca]|uniref:Ankyrin n=1 Tax=Echria macrotheca TaxID=438768 RepID=A0AAJ0BNE3_9PEZI|nr:hypothetical protein QBC47DRAFT_373452 [Echria macrotheca]
MKWACKSGVDSLVHTALAYGASVGTVDVVTEPEKQMKTLTLYLAAKFRRLETFKLLINLGARTDEAGVPALTVKQFVRRLCASGPLLVAFLDAGMISQLPRGLLGKILVSVILDLSNFQDDPSERLKCIQLLLDGGADPNYITFRGKTTKESICPLSAAVFTNSFDVFDLLIERGADAKTVRDPPNPLYPPERPCHHPILAAVVVLATSDNFNAEPLQRCIDAGGDMEMVVGARYRHFRGVPYLLRLLTPVDLYLGAVRNWEGEAENGRDAAWGLKYLLDRGALPYHFSESEHLEHLPQHFIDALNLTKEGYRSLYMRDQPIWVPRPFPQELLDRRHISVLAKSIPLLSVVKLLLAHGHLSTKEVAIFLARYDYRSCVDTGPSPVPAWTEIIDAVAVKYASDLDMLLYTYIEDKETHCHRRRLLYPGPNPHHVGELAITTVQRLVAAGANINFRPKDCKGEERPTILALLCQHYAKLPPWIRRLKSVSDWDMHGNSYALRITHRLTPQRKRFVEWLVCEAGADPTIGAKYPPLDSQVCSPAEMFMEVMKKGLWQDTEGELADQLCELFDRFSVSGDLSHAR